MKDTNSILSSIDNKLNLIVNLLTKKNKKSKNSKVKKVNETKVKIIKTELLVFI